MNAALLQPVALCAAFWTALFLYARRARPPQPLRFACALALGAALAHAGWLLLHAPAVWPAIRARPGLLIDPSLGFCVLFAPLGLLLLERSAAAFASLPLALAVARLGCLAAGCCHGTPTAMPWAVAGLHPSALYEIAGLLALHGLVSRAEARFAAPLVLGGIGALRLLIDPLRVAPPLGAPIVPPAAIAAAWLALAAVLAWSYLASATLKRFHDDGSPAADLPILRFACETCFERAELALDGILRNLPTRATAAALRVLTLSFGRRERGPDDRLGGEVARVVLDDASVRERLTAGIYQPSPDELGLGRLDAALADAQAALPVEAKLRRAVRDGLLAHAPGDALARAAHLAGLLSNDDLALLRDADRARDEAIQVDAFSPEEFSRARSRTT